jgi:hypothetical protein
MAYTPEQLAIIAQLEGSVDGTPIDIDDFIDGENVEALTWNSRQSLDEALFTRIWSRIGERYLKPVLGVPEADLDNNVVVKLNAGYTAYQKPPGGIPASDLDISWKAPVANLTALNALTGNLDGDVRYVISEQELYKFVANKWLEVNDEEGGGSQDPSTTSGLTYGYRGGSVRIDNNLVFFSGGTIVLQANTLNYIEVDNSGVVTSNFIGFSSSRVPLAEVTTNGSSIVLVNDRRDALISGLPAGGGRLKVNQFTAGSPTQSNFILDFSSNPNEIMLFLDGTLVTSNYNWTLIANNLNILPALDEGTVLTVVGAESVVNNSVAGAMGHLQLIGISDGIQTDYPLPGPGAEEFIVLGYAQQAIRNVDYIRITILGDPYIQFINIPPLGVYIHASVSMNIATVDPALVGFLEENADFHSGLNYAFKAGRVRNGATVISVASGTILLTASSTNYVEVDNTGTVLANTVGFTIGAIPLALATTNATNITLVQDQRTWLVF